MATADENAEVAEVMQEECIVQAILFGYSPQEALDCENEAICGEQCIYLRGAE